MKIVVHDLGEEEFRRQVEEAFQHFLTLDTDFSQAEYDRLAAYYTPPPFESGLPDDIDRSDPDLALWVDKQVIAHKTPGYANPNIRTNPNGSIGAHPPAEQQEAVAGTDGNERVGCREEKG